MQSQQSASSSDFLSTDELSLRWIGLPTPGTLRNWRVYKKGPRFEVQHVAGVRHVVYPLAAVQEFELRCSSIPRHKPWSGKFLSVQQLLERWKGKPDEVTGNALREWRSERGRRNGPNYLCVHLRQALYPIEAVRMFEADRAAARAARTRNSAHETSGVRTYGEILLQGPQV